jgi:hypothetical protein
MGKFMFSSNQIRRTESWEEYLKDKNKIEPEVPKVDNVEEIRKNALRKSQSGFTSTTIKNPQIRRSASDVSYVIKLSEEKKEELEHQK